MADPAKRIYWDACVFLSYLNNFEGRAELLEEILRQAKLKKVLRIYTSTVSLVEVSFFAEEKTGKTLSDEARTRIDELWSDEEAVTVVEFHTLVAREARELVRLALPEGWALKPLDAIHLATAKRLKIEEFHTYDGPLNKYADAIGMPIRQPGLPQGLLGLETKKSP